MGIDWIPFKPKRAEDTPVVQALASRQARAFHALPEYWSVDPLVVVFASEDYEADKDAHSEQLQEYRESSRLLDSLVDVGHSATHPELVDSFRIAVIGCLRLIPPQWRMRAYRTITADCLADQLSLWQKWISAVRSGSLRHYLAQLYVYEIRMELYAAWWELEKGASLVRQRSNRWVTRDSMKQLYSEIDALPEPALLGAPLQIPDTFKEQPVEPGQAELLVSVEAETSAMRRLLRKWNRNAKEEITSQWELACFDDFVNDAHGSWIDEFFNWADHWATRGFGLLLDY